MSDCIIHVGFPKTASTTFQYEFFPKHKDFLFLGLPIKNKELLKFFEVDLLIKGPEYYDPLAMKKAVWEEIDRLKKDNPDYKKVVFSHERCSLVSREGRYNERSLILSRVVEIFEKPQIILCIRNQFKWPSSAYMTGLRGGVSASFKQYLDSCWDHFFTEFFPQLEYLSYIKMCEEMVGKENVLILVFEEFCKDPQKHFDKMCEFSGVSKMQVNGVRKNRSFSYPSFLMRKVMNQLVRFDSGQSRYHMGTRRSGQKAKKTFKYCYKVGTSFFLEWFDRTFHLKSYKPALPEEYKERMVKLYGESNRRIQEEYGFDLKSLGYPYS